MFQDICVNSLVRYYTGSNIDELMETIKKWTKDLHVSADEESWKMYYVNVLPEK